jgi:hypothetical protein
MPWMMMMMMLGHFLTFLMLPKEQKGANVPQKNMPTKTLNNSATNDRYNQNLGFLGPQ